MFKKILSMALVAAISAGIAIGGTIAYLQSQDSDVNTMTMGNVKIEQIEQERDADGKLVAFEDKDLYPAVYEGSSIPWAAEDKWVVPGDQAWKVVEENGNVVDKFVTVKNTGESAAYVRTLIAYEGDMTYGPEGAYIHVVHNGSNVDPAVAIELVGVIEVDEDDGKVKYTVYTYTYPVALASGETTIPSLKQVYMDKTATNEVVAEYGESYKILALSQAVQKAGFADAATALDTAFGDVTKDNATAWFKEILAGVKVSDDAELAAAIEAGETTIALKPGTYHMPNAAQGKTLTINGTKDSIIEVVPAGQSEAGGQLDYSLDGSKVTFNGVTIKTNSQLYAGYARLSGTYNDCVIQNTYNLGLGDSAFYNCEINITNEYLRVGGATTAIFDGCTFNTDGRAILVFQDGTSVAQTVTVKDCTFNATAAANTWNGIHVAAVSIDGTKGTYTVNLEGNNTVDSDFNGLWQIKAGEANVTVNE